MTKITTEKHLYFRRAVKWLSYKLHGPRHGVPPKTWMRLGRTNVIDFHGEFRRVDGLGLGLPIVLVVKNEKKSMAMINQRRVYRDVERQGKMQELLVPLRSSIEHGFVAVLKVANKTIGGRYVWLKKGLEPRGFAQSGSSVFIAFANEIHIVDGENGVTIKVIKHPKFRAIHTLAFNPWDKNRLLVANTGLNSILEVDLEKEDITWEWDAFSHGYAENPFGLKVIPKGKPIGRDLRVISHDEAIAKMKRGKIEAPTGKDLAVEINLETLPHPLGLEKWQNTAAPNYANYGARPDQIFATLFFADQAVVIDKNSGNVKVVRDDLKHPHGMLVFGDDYVVSDTRHGQVLLLDQNFTLKKVYDFSGMPHEEKSEGGYSESGEWLQYTNPINNGNLLATVDSYRSVLLIWDPARKVYSQYPLDKDWIVQAVLPFKAL